MRTMRLAAVVVLARAIALAVAGVGWWLLFPSKMRPQLRTCVLLRFVREATNVLLPLAQVGGDFIQRPACSRRRRTRRCRWQLNSIVSIANAAKSRRRCRRKRWPTCAA